MCICEELELLCRLRKVQVNEFKSSFPPNNVITIISCAAFTENQPVHKINECCHLNSGGIQDLSSLAYRRIKGEAP